jgi:hypothetical protein
VEYVPENKKTDAIIATARQACRGPNGVSILNEKCRQPAWVLRGSFTFDSKLARRRVPAI